MRPWCLWGPRFLYRTNLLLIPHKSWFPHPRTILYHDLPRAELLRIQWMECPTSKAQKQETAKPSLCRVARMAAVFKQAS